MMDQIVKSKKASTSSSTVIVGIIIMGVVLVALVIIIGVVTSGEKQHRGVNAFLADATGDGESIDVRQHDVQHDEVRLHFFDNLNGFGTGSGGVNLCRAAG